MRVANATKFDRKSGVPGRAIPFVENLHLLVLSSVYWGGFNVRRLAKACGLAGVLLGVLGGYACAAEFPFQIQSRNLPEAGRFRTLRLWT
jgi:hypothetical protein